METQDETEHAPAEHGATPRAHLEGARALRILLVEDETRMAQLIKRGLDEEGHLADICATGSLALEQALSIPYDVIVLDWALPDSGRRERPARLAQARTAHAGAHADRPGIDR